MSTLQSKSGILRLCSRVQGIYQAKDHGDSAMFGEEVTSMRREILETLQKHPVGRRSTLSIGMDPRYSWVTRLFSCCWSLTARRWHCFHTTTLQLHPLTLIVISLWLSFSRLIVRLSIWSPPQAPTHPSFPKVDLDILSYQVYVSILFADAYHGVRRCLGSLPLQTIFFTSHLVFLGRKVYATIMVLAAACTFFLNDPLAKKAGIVSEIEDSLGFKPGS